jgi:hypothetical protein
MDMRRAKRAVTTLLLVFLVCSAGASCKSASPWKLTYQVAGGSLTSISAADSSHVWTVGSGQVYFSGSGDWAKQADLGGDLLSVSAADTKHVWASGREGTDTAQSTGVIYFFDGSKWSRQFGSADQMIDHVAAGRADNVWASGWTGTEGHLYHFDGQAWSLYGSVGHVQDIAVTGGGAFLVQEPKQGASEVMAFNGTAWASYYTAKSTRLGIAFSGPSTIWTVGGSASKSESVIQLMSYPEPGKVTDYTAPDFLTKVTAADSTHVWAVGGTGYKGPVYFFDGKKWISQYAGGEPLLGVCQAGPDRAWACGSLGAVYSYAKGGSAP